MSQLHALADTYDFSLVVNNTIGNFLNVNVLKNGLTNEVCTSLTKLMLGHSDVIAGSIVTNLHMARGRWMQHNLQWQQGT